MAGLSLGMGSSGYGGATGSLPSAANQPTGTTISQSAFGISTGLSSGPETAANGALVTGAIAAGVLAWLWWTLPR